VPELDLVRLEQSYERLAERRYAYSAPSNDYAEVLQLNETGFVADYPGLWKEVPAGP
jgi:hypothetical protein